jgi:hypothetical protein
MAGHDVSIVLSGIVESALAPLCLSLNYPSDIATDMDKESAEHLAKALAPACVRNGFIEDLLCGRYVLKIRRLFRLSWSSRLGLPQSAPYASSPYAPIRAFRYFD